MKKRNIFLLVFILIIFVGSVIMGVIQSNSYNVKSFNASDYQSYIEDFSSEENVGSIIDSKDAIKKAEKIWIELYGEGVKKEKPYQIFYDEKNGIWFIHGSLPPNMKGGVANILIENSTGDVLAVWHEK